MMGSICMGLMTSELNWGSMDQHKYVNDRKQDSRMNMALILLSKSILTVPGNFGETGRSALHTDNESRLTGLGFHRDS
jgi:hypothetical protein